MKTILRFNPALCSINIGDQIIVNSILEQMKDIFKDHFIIDVSSHQPISWIYYARVLRNIDVSFVLGSNLLRGKLNSVDRQWDINIFNAKKLGPTILVGVGWRAYNENINFYTKKIYRKILSKNYFHSVRDNYTKQKLESIGFSNVLNTSCPTMWNLTEDFCKKIPTQKSENVVTTITDYQKDPEKDKTMMDILCDNYKNVYLWIQGSEDKKYVDNICKNKRVNLIEPNLKAYDNFLENTNVDYIGTRLHGGIRALQKCKRTIIIGTDNRATEKKKDFNLPVLERNKIFELENVINKSFKTEIKIPINEIKKWKEQFERWI